MSRRWALSGLLSLALAVPAAAAEPPAGFQGGPTHSGFVDAPLAPPLGKRWMRADLGGPGHPIIYEGRVFVTTYASGDGTTTLHALDAATGATLWTAGNVIGRVSAGHGQVYTQSGREITARDAASGAVRWTVANTSEYFGGEPVADGEHVLVGGRGIRALRPSDGAVVWDSPAQEGSSGVAAGDGERAFALTGCGGVMAVRNTLGLPAWDKPPGCTGGENSDPPIVAEGRVWGEESVHAADDGAELGEWQGARPAVAGGRTVAASQGTLTARDLDGRLVWKATAPQIESYERLPGEFLTRPLIVGGVVYVQVSGMVLAGYSLATGALVWSSSTRAPLLRRDGESFRPKDGLAARGDRLVVQFADRLMAYGPGADAPGVDPDAWRDPSAVILTLGTPRHPTSLKETSLITFGDSVVMRYEEGRKVGRDFTRAVHLETDAFPFGDWEAARPLGPQDSTLIRVKPERNTRYRLRHDGVTPAKYTELREVKVNLGFDVKYRYLSRTRLRARARLTGPADALSGERMDVPFYFFRKSTGWATRLKSVKLRRTRTGATATTVLRVPRRFGKKDYVFACLRERRDDGFGVFEDYMAACGRKRVR
jgi:outer membrane protein assembly factor BamB